MVSLVSLPPCFIMIMSSFLSLSDLFFCALAVLIRPVSNPGNMALNIIFFMMFYFMYERFSSSNVMSFYEIRNISEIIFFNGYRPWTVDRGRARAHIYGLM